MELYEAGEVVNHKLTKEKFIILPWTGEGSISGDKGYYVHNEKYEKLYLYEKELVKDVLGGVDKALREYKETFTILKKH